MIGETFELALLTPDMIVDEILRLNEIGPELLKERDRAEKALLDHGSRLGKLIMQCTHTKGGRSMLQRGEDRFKGGPLHMTCRICERRLPCPHKDPTPAWTGFTCDDCGVTANYHKGERFPWR